MLLEEIWEQSKIVKIKSRWKFTKTWIRFHLSPRRLSLELPCSVDRFYFFVLACFSLLASTSDSSKSGCHDNSLILIFYFFFLAWVGGERKDPAPAHCNPLHLCSGGPLLYFSSPFWHMRKAMSEQTHANQNNGSSALCQCPWNSSWER